ncbi:MULTISPECIES: hypothetical protein [unclassified Streptomyces]|uniref:hypothetical protein n=1 Tax=unclassified Streptomyces TaxID=2593676 RepID=UPI00381E5FA6
MRASDVVRIVVHTPEAAVHPLIHSKPRTGLQGKFSLEYALTSALLDDHPGFVSYTDGYVERPPAQRLIGPVEAVRTSKGPGRLTGDTSVEITIGHGTVPRTTLAPPPVSSNLPQARKSSPQKSPTAGQMHPDCSSASTGRVPHNSCATLSPYTIRRTTHEPASPRRNHSRQPGAGRRSALRHPSARRPGGQSHQGRTPGYR